MKSRFVAILALVVGVLVLLWVPSRNSSEYSTRTSPEIIAVAQKPERSGTDSIAAGSESRIQVSETTRLEGISSHEMESALPDARHTQAKHNEPVSVDPLVASNSVSSLISSNNLPDSFPVELMWIDPGTFVMERLNYDNAADRNKEEVLKTQITITRGFWMSKYEVTIGQFIKTTGGSKLLPALGRVSKSQWNRADSNISWHEAIWFCDELTEQARLAGSLPEGYVYRLPTEAEWEYACRAGTTTMFSFGDDADGSKLKEFAWFSQNSDGTVRPVGRKGPNPWGLYDMHGNVAEWTLDSLKFGAEPLVDPVGQVNNRSYVTRGGAWSASVNQCRSSARHSMLFGDGHRESGFRVVLAAPIAIDQTVPK